MSSTIVEKPQEVQVLRGLVQKTKSSSTTKNSIRGERSPFQKQKHKNL